MSDPVIVDEWVVTIRMPHDLPAGEAEAVRVVLSGDEFPVRLRAAVDAVFRSFLELDRVTVVVAR